MNPVVMVDVDGVLADFMYGFRSLVRDHFVPGVHVYGHGDPRNVSWDCEEILPAIHGKAWSRIRSSDRFWYELPDMVTAEERLRLSRLGSTHDLYFVTARVGRSCRLQTEAWLQDRLGIVNPHVIVSSMKGEAAVVLNARFAIDDKAGNAICTAYLSRETRSFILDRPYNQFDHNVVGSRVKRVKTVLEFIETVEEGE